MTEPGGSMRDQLAAISDEIFGGQQGQEQEQELAAEEEVTGDGEELPTDEEQEQGEAEGDEPGEQAPDEPGEDITSFNALAKALDWDPTDIYSLTVNVDMGDQKSEEVTLEQLKNAYKASRDAPVELQKQREAMQRESQVFHHQARQVFEAVGRVSEEELAARGSMMDIEQKFSGIDWDKLDREDPERAERERMRFGRAYAKARSDAEAAKAQAQQMQAAMQQQYQMQQDRILLELVPEWKDPKVAQAEIEEINAFLYRQGFSPEDLPGRYDARERVIARMGMLYEKLVKNQQAGVERVKRVPKSKTLSAGKRANPTVLNRSKAEQLANRARKTGSRADAIAAGMAELQAAGIKL